MRSFQNVKLQFAFIKYKKNQILKMYLRTVTTFNVSNSKTVLDLIETNSFCQINKINYCKLEKHLVVLVYLYSIFCKDASQVIEIKASLFEEKQCFIKRQVGF